MMLFYKDKLLASINEKCNRTIEKTRMVYTVDYNR